MTGRPSFPTATTPALLAGLIGALAMNIGHEATRRLVPRSPRLDRVGHRGLALGYRALSRTPPGSAQLQREALAGDLMANAAWFAGAVMLGSGSSAPGRGALAGALAGGATLVLAPRLGLIRARPTPTTRGLALAFYVGGGLVAGLAYRRFRAAGGS